MNLAVPIIPDKFSDGRHFCTLAEHFFRCLHSLLDVADKPADEVRAYGARRGVELVVGHGQVQFVGLVPLQNLDGRQDCTTTTTTTTAAVSAENQTEWDGVSKAVNLALGGIPRE